MVKGFGSGTFGLSLATSTSSSSSFPALVLDFLLEDPFGLVTLTLVDDFVEAFVLVTPLGVLGVVSLNFAGVVAAFLDLLGVLAGYSSQT